VRAPLALVADLVAVLVFAAAGRASHAEENAALGVLTTAWPFIAALLLSWFVVMVRARRLPLDVSAAVPVWLGTVALGMALRAATGRGVAVSFVLVATVVLGVLLLGWRAAWARRHATP
jgi:FtsH-binding integral membrane protein